MNLVNLDSVLACSVRGCGEALTRRENSWRCIRGHSFDIARSGYLNLLQPQDRRSAEPGDSRAAIDARARALAAGAGGVILQRFVERAAALPFADGSVVVDLGCGAGDALAALTALKPVAGIGIDLSVTAVDIAARRFPAMTWLVANADRRLPVCDHRAACVLSLHGRRNPVECARILPAGGHLIVAVPAADDLIELREAVQGTRDLRDRSEPLTAAHQPWFDLIERSTVRETVQAGTIPLTDLLHGTYRGVRSAEAARVTALENMDVTLASDILLFRAIANGRALSC